MSTSTMPCPMCGHAVRSDSGPNCPQCGNPVPKGADSEVEESEDYAVIKAELTIDDEEVNPAASESAAEELPIQLAAAYVDEELTAQMKAGGAADEGFRPQHQTTTTAQEPARPGERDRPSSPPPSHNDNSFKRLSEEEVKEISQELYGGADFLSEAEKASLLKSSRETVKDDLAPIVPPKREPHVPTPEELDFDGPHPKMASRARGIAFFARNYIQITGWHGLHDGDELRINDREYVLRKKTFNTRLLWGSAAVLGTVVFFTLLAVLFGGNTLDGGRVIGVVLDNSNHPYIQGASIRFPDLGKSFNSNGQGLFEAENIPTGSHTIELLLDGKVVGIDHATVASGKTTMLTVQPNNTTSSSPQKTTRTAVSTTAPLSMAKPTSTSKSRTKSAATAQRSSKSSRRAATESGSTRSRYAKLNLQANINGARLSLDGNVIGAGNLTYTKLKPGLHHYVVTQAGYETARGKVTLSKGKTTNLKVSLKPLDKQAKANTYTEKDFLAAGKVAIKEGRYGDAVNDLSEVIKQHPGNAMAYRLRAEAQTAQEKSQAAFDDYVRAAEIYRFGGELNSATTMYNKAVKLNPRSVTALLGRGDLYLDQKQEIAAVTDFETVIRLDRHEPRGYIGLGKARYRQGMYSKAIKAFKDARSLDKGNVTAHRSLMHAYLKAGKIKDVIKSYHRFEEDVSPDDVAKFNNDKRNAAILRLVQNEKR